MKKAPTAFIESFIQKEHRERVSHEWCKKEEKLYYKICHNSEELFKPECSGRASTINSNESCFMLSGSRINEVLYSEAEKKIDTGYGVLIVTTSGNKFYAESESTKGYPSVSYAGG